MSYRPCLTALFIDIFDKDKIGQLKLSDQEIEYVRYLLSDNPEIFQKIQSAIEEIMKDGQIDLHDLPQIVVLVSNIMHVNFISVSKKVDILNVIEYIMDTIIESGFLPIPAVELPILERIVNSSITLLRMNLGRKDQGSLSWSCFC